MNDDLTLLGGVGSTRFGLAGILASLIVLVGGYATYAQDGESADNTQPGDGPSYPVSQILLGFAPDLPVHPPASQLMALSVTLGASPTGQIMPRHGVQTTDVRIADIPKLETQIFHASAITQIGQRIVRHFAGWGYSGIVVVPNLDDIDAAGVDVRPEGQTALRLVIKTDGTWAGVSSQPGETALAKPLKVTHFVVSFDLRVPRRPPVAEVMRYTVDLADVPDGYVGPRAGRMAVRLRLGDVPKLPKHDFYPTAIQTVCHRLADHLSDRGFKGLECVPHPDEINAEGLDTRFPNQTALRLVVRIAPLNPEIELATTPLPPPVESEPLAEATEADGQVYPLGQLIVEYAQEHPVHPPIRSVMKDVVLSLAETEDGYVAARPDTDAIEVPLMNIPLLPKPFLYGSAILQISQKIVADYSQRGYIGINVTPHPEDIDQTATDVRPEGMTVLRMLVKVGVVSEIRTVAAGDRVPQAERINHPVHRRLVEQSPVRPAGSEDEERSDLMNKDALDNYVSRLNRHPGRRVDVAVSPGSEAGGVALDLLVTESKPWIAYLQASNTGTEQTEQWRERFGFVHHQLTNHDDTLSVDYITAGFDSAHAVVAAYEAPLFDAERVRWRVHGMWSEFTASDVGFAGEDFTGNEWSAGGDLILNVLQDKELFVDLIGGAQWQFNRTNNQILGQEGEVDFFLPHVSLRVQRESEESNFYGLVDFQINASDAAGTDREQMAFLGRDLLGPGGSLSDVEDDFKRLTWETTYSFYLEPILWGKAYRDPSTPESSTLAHEMAFTYKGQWSPDRVVPQFERTIGGLYSVRGYEESITAADTVQILNVEYRLHIPRLFGLEPDAQKLFGKPFRWAPQQVYGRPDWDLIFRGFFDYGTTHNTDRRMFEEDFNLMSAGAGVEVLYKQNVNARMDWGVVMEELQHRASSGSTQVHIVVTILY